MEAFLALRFCTKRKSTIPHSRVDLNSDYILTSWNKGEDIHLTLPCSSAFSAAARCLTVPCSSSGKKNKLRVYYLSWLRNRILHNDPEVEKKQGWITVGELEGCVHYKVGT